MTDYLLSFFGPIGYSMHLVGMYVITGGVSAILLFLMARIDKGHRKRDMLCGVIELAISLSGILIIHAGFNPSFLLWIMMGMFVFNGVYPVDTDFKDLFKIGKRKK